MGDAVSIPLSRFPGVGVGVGDDPGPGGRRAHGPGPGRRLAVLIALPVLLALGCARSPFAPPACSDGIDNDGDGRTDSADPDCSDPGDDSENPGPSADADADGEDDAEAEVGGEDAPLDEPEAEDAPLDEVGELDAPVDEVGADEAEACAGCWREGVCVDGAAVDACGTGGGTCVSCDDGLGCTRDLCTSGACGHESAPDGTACTDPTGGLCVSGSCARIWNGAAGDDAFGASVSLGPGAATGGPAYVLIGAPGQMAGTAGRAYLYAGPATDPVRSWAGEGGERLGSGVSLGPKCASGDGASCDLVLGAPGYDRPDPLAEMAGRDLVLSAEGGPALWSRTGDAAYDLRGSAVSLGPDATGDGAGDFLIGTPMADTDPGAADDIGQVDLEGDLPRVVVRTWRGAAGEGFGKAVSLGPDVDGDGLGDVLIGAPSAADGGFSLAGRAYLYRSTSDTPAWRQSGEESDAVCGTSVSLGPDLNGDGRGDAAIGAPFHMPGGRVYVDSGAGGGCLYRLGGTTLEVGAAFGLAVSVGPDADGDGRGDLLVGAPGDGDAGRAYLFSGADGSTLAVWAGEEAGDFFGAAVALGPGGDGDAAPWALVGAPRADGPGGGDSGKAYLFDLRSWPARTGELPDLRLGCP
jgi:hypothetical protein